MKEYLKVQVKITVLNQSDVCTVSQADGTKDNMFECPNFFPASLVD